MAIDLPSSLVKKFVNLTKNEEERTGYYSYATGITNGDEKYVQLDGSDAITSVSLATDLSTGDRVLVYIEDHVANVIGNITYPSSGRGLIEVSNRILDVESWTVGELAAIDAEFENVYSNYVSTAYLEANYITSEYIVANYLLADTALLTFASIEDLEATNAVIENLKSTSITVEYLEANYASIIDLSAVRAWIGELESNMITTEYLEANYASIGDLTAINGYIQILDSDYATIKTLLAGYEGVGELQAIHLTSDNVVIEDALITDAMIANLTADKITAGTIYTSKVKIQTAENDESLYLGNSLIQMSDENIVRFQAGKDALDEYNLYIWNSEGKLMFDALGTTSDGIGQEVIVNTHVANDANIAGYKLDIQSVASELNADGSLTVNSSNIYVGTDSLDFKLAEITDMIYGISMEGLQHYYAFYALWYSDTDPPYLPDEVIPALTDEAETDYSYTDLYETELWVRDQPQAGDDEYVWVVYYLEYEDGVCIWSDPTCLTDGVIKRKTTDIYTELEVIDGKISGKIWMSDIEESLTTAITDVWTTFDVTMEGFSAEIGKAISDSEEGLKALFTNEINALDSSFSIELQENYVTKASLVLELNEKTGVATLTANADKIAFTGSQITIDADNFTLTEDGRIYAVNAELEGYIVADSGYIGNWIIDTDALYNGTKSMTNTTNGMYLGVSGIRNYYYGDYVNVTSGYIKNGNSDNDYSQLYSGTLRFAHDGVLMGHYGTGYYVGEPTKYGLVIDVENECNYIGFARRRSATDDTYTWDYLINYGLSTGDDYIAYEQKHIFYGDVRITDGIYIGGSDHKFYLRAWDYKGDPAGIGTDGSLFVKGVVYAGNYDNTSYLTGSNEASLCVEDSAIITGILYLPKKGIAIANNYGVYHYLADGSDFKRFEYLDTSNQLHVGNSSYATILSGSSITSNADITIGESSTTSTRIVNATNKYGSVNMGVSSAGNKGLYDKSFSKWIICSTSSGSIVTDSLIATVAVLSDDMDSGIETLAAGTFIDPGSDLLANLTSHTYTVDGKKHIGFAVDELEDAMEKTGMNPDDYDITEHWEEDGREVVAIRYEELIPILVKEIQQLTEQVKTLQAAIG